MKPWGIIWGGTGLVFATLLLLNSCSTTPSVLATAPTIPGATFVGNQSCFECHTNIVRQFPTSAHARIHLAGQDRRGQTGCESCHGAGSNYIKMKTMEGVRDGSIKPEDVGLTLPNKETCAHCHNEKATGGQFVDWPKDSTEIAHPIPPGYKRGAATEAKEGAK